MNETVRLFFQLVKISLGNADRFSRSLSKTEWENLYDIAEKHAVVGICFIGIQRLPKEQLPGKYILMEWMGQTERIRTRNAHMDECCLKLQNLLQSEGQQCCILKGQGTATYYGDAASYRQSGDIDVWMAGGFCKVVESVCKISPTENVYNHHIELRVFDDVDVEAHFIPCRRHNLFADRRLRKWFVKQEQSQMPNLIPFNGTKLHAPTVEFNLVFMMLHIYRHFFTEGIGLRQIMDYYYALKTANLDEARVRGIRYAISSFGIEKFACGIMWVLNETLGMDISLTLWTPDEKNGRFLLSEIIQMGNLGQYDNRFRLNHNDSHIMRYLQMVMSKLRFVRYYPLEVLWQPIEIFVLFFEIRLYKKRLVKIISSKPHNISSV